MIAYGRSIESTETTVTLKQKPFEKGGRGTVDTIENLSIGPMTLHQLAYMVEKSMIIQFSFQ